MPNVSVIIPTYNREKYVVKAIASVLQQTYTDYEIVVVDDGSTDNTREILKKYGNRIDYINQINAGVSAARNTGIKSSTGDWIAFLDSDDEWDEEYLEYQMMQVKRHSTAIAHVTDSRLIDINGEVNKKTDFEVRKLDKEFINGDSLVLSRPLYTIVKYMTWYMPVIVINRLAFEKVGYFDEELTIAEDQDLYLRLSTVGSFTMLRRALVSVIRRREEIINLASRATTDGIYTRNKILNMLKDIRINTKLSKKEIYILDDKISSLHRSIGNLYLINGKAKEARQYFMAGVSVDPSIKSIIKLIISYMPLGVAKQFIPKGKDIEPKTKGLK